MEELNQDNNWTTIIKPKNKLLDIDLREVWNYKDLISLLVKRDFITYYKQTILGPLWYLIQPLLSTIVFTVIFGKVAKISTDGLPQVLFYMSGVVCWSYFSSCLNQTSDTFSANANIFGKVYFPRIVIPISVVLSNLINFAIQFILFAAFFMYFYLHGSAVHLSIWIFLFPLLVIQMGMLGLGFGILISSMTTKYRDLKFLVSFGIQLWMYATPIVYPLSQIPEKWRWIYVLNPMSSVVEVFRSAFLGTGEVNLSQLVLSLSISILIFIIGIISFNRIEKSFMDTV